MPRAARASTKAATASNTALTSKTSRESKAKRVDESESQQSEEEVPVKKVKKVKGDDKLANKKIDAWSPYLSKSPFPEYGHPTVAECTAAHTVLKAMHQEAVATEFEDEDTPETIPHVLDAMVVAVLSQATGWNNAKRAMNSLRSVYGSVFAYEKIMAGGQEKLAETLKPGGLHKRKSMIITTILNQVKERYNMYDLDHMFNLSDEDVMKELLNYKYIGTKSASVVTGWCLKRNPFTVDTHVYRISGLWKWRPDSATREKTQSHLEVMIPPQYKFDLHFLLIAHGRTCPACIGGAKGGKQCTAVPKIKELLALGEEGDVQAS